VDGEEAPIFVKVMNFVEKNDRKITTLVPLLRLLSACYDPRFGGEGMGEIDAVIGGPILLPAESISFNFHNLDPKLKRIAAASTFHATNWVRELLNSFVHDASFPKFSITHPPVEEKCQNADIRDKIVRRLTTLIDLEDDLLHMAANCDDFAPPGSASLESAGFSKDIDAMGVDDDFVGDFIPPTPPDCTDMDKDEKKAVMAEFGTMLAERKKAHKKKETDLERGEKNQQKVSALLTHPWSRT